MTVQKTQITNISNNLLWTYASESHITECLPIRQESVVLRPGMYVAGSDVDLSSDPDNSRYVKYMLYLFSKALWYPDPGR
jgi:hypothetical protein